MLNWLRHIADISRCCLDYITSSSCLRQRPETRDSRLKKPKTQNTRLKTQTLQRRRRRRRRWRWQKGKSVTDTLPSNRLTIRNPRCGYPYHHTTHILYSDLGLPTLRRHPLPYIHNLFCHSVGAERKVRRMGGGAQKEGDSIRNRYAKNEKKRAEIWEVSGVYRYILIHYSY